MKTLAAILLWSALAYAQGGNMVVRTAAGAPSGSCAFVLFYINSTNGDFYGCKLGAWQLLGPGVAGAGTVTNVTWTGGIVSIATSTTTPAFTIAGTSGGIPYFNSASTWASSGALTANLPVIGGGAGVAPSVGTRSGNTTAFVTTTGAQTNGDCVSIDANGNHVAQGAACGTGTVTSVTGTAPVTSSGGATPAIGCATCVTSAAALTSNAFVFGAGSQASKTLAGFTSDGTSAATFGAAGTGTGKLTFAGTTSGSAAISVAAAAGTPNDILLPTATGAVGDALTTNGANPQQTSWAPHPMIFTRSFAAGIFGGGTTFYCGLWDIGGSNICSGTEALRQAIMPVAITIRSFYMITSTAQPGTGTLVATVMSCTPAGGACAGGATAATITIGAGAAAGTFSITGLSVAVAAGDLLSVQFVNNAATNSAAFTSVSIFAN